MMSATQTARVPILFNGRLGHKPVFIKEAYYQYYHCIVPYAAAPAMTAYNGIIAINLSRNRTQSSELFYGHWSSFKGRSPNRAK